MILKINIILRSPFNVLHSVLVGERAKRARHSQVCSIENRGYIYIYLFYTSYSYNSISRYAYRGISALIICLIGPNTLTLIGLREINPIFHSYL